MPLYVSGYAKCARVHQTDEPEESRTSEPEKRTVWPGPSGSEVADDSDAHIGEVEGEHDENKDETTPEFSVSQMIAFIDLTIKGLLKHPLCTNKTADFFHPIAAEIKEVYARSHPESLFSKVQAKGMMMQTSMRCAAFLNG